MNKRFAKLILTRMDHDHDSPGHDHATYAEVADHQPGAFLVGGTNHPLGGPSALSASPGAAAHEFAVRHRLWDRRFQEPPQSQSPGWSNDHATSAWSSTLPVDVPGFWPAGCAAPRGLSPALRVSPDATAVASAPAAASDRHPTKYDVLNGRGQGVQRHPGNVKYRTLVYLNKGLYAKCPRADKAKISKGIVAAVRELGGRFLELDERSGAYRDIGDKKAYEKTSQALREGQTRIRRELYTMESNLGGDLSPSGITAEGYFGYSVRVLESLCKSEADGAEVRISPCASPVAAAASNHREAPAPAACEVGDGNVNFRMARV